MRIDWRAWWVVVACVRTLPSRWHTQVCIHSLHPSYISVNGRIVCKVAIRGSDFWEIWQCFKKETDIGINTFLYCRCVWWMVGTPVYSLSCCVCNMGYFNACCWIHVRVNLLMPELNPSAQRRLTRFFTGDFASWTVHFVNICVKSQQIHQLFIQFINYVW
jgi:hypothetical protein